MINVQTYKHGKDNVYLINDLDKTFLPFSVTRAVDGKNIINDVIFAKGTVRNRSFIKAEHVDTDQLVARPNSAPIDFAAILRGEQVNKARTQLEDMTTVDTALGKFSFGFTEEGKVKHEVLQGPQGLQGAQGKCCAGACKAAAKKCHAVAKAAAPTRNIHLKTGKNMKEAAAVALDGKLWAAKKPKFDFKPVTDERTAELKDEVLRANIKLLCTGYANANIRELGLDKEEAASNNRWIYREPYYMLYRALDQVLAKSPKMKAEALAKANLKGKVAKRHKKEGNEKHIDKIAAAGLLGELHQLAVELFKA